MLDEFVELHGCTRHHAGWLLRMWGKTVFEHCDGELVKIVVGQRRPRRRSRRIYDEQVLAALRKMACPEVAEDHKGRLRRHFNTLNPAELQREMVRLQGELLSLVQQRSQPAERAG